jgi:hypothetical protein
MVGKVDPLRSVVVATVPLTAVVVVIEPSAKTVVAVVVWLGRVALDPWREEEPGSNVDKMSEPPS